MFNLSKKTLGRSFQPKETGGLSGQERGWDSWEGDSEPSIHHAWGSEGVLWAPPVGSGTKPQPTMILVLFEVKAGFHPTQRMQRAQRTQHSATYATYATHVTQATQPTHATQPCMQWTLLVDDLFGLVHCAPVQPPLNSTPLSATLDLWACQILAGLRPRPRWGNLQRSPRPPSWIKGTYF